MLIFSHNIRDNYELKRSSFLSFKTFHLRNHMHFFSGVVKSIALFKKTNNAIEDGDEADSIV